VTKLSALDVGDLFQFLNRNDRYVRRVVDPASGRYQTVGVFLGEGACRLAGDVLVGKVVLRVFEPSKEYPAQDRPQRSVRRLSLALTAKAGRS
jgi:hypothetical protein